MKLKKYKTFRPQKIREQCESTFSEYYNKIVNFYVAIQ